MLTDIIPAKNRKRFYAYFGLLGVALAATQVAYVAAATGQPLWLTVALAVYGFLGGAFGATATQNVTVPGYSIAGELADADGLGQ